MARPFIYILRVLRIALHIVKQFLGVGFEHGPQLHRIKLLIVDYKATITCKGE
jgi:hypothetical protein